MKLIRVLNLNDLTTSSTMTANKIAMPADSNTPNTIGGNGNCCQHRDDTNPKHTRNNQQTNEAKECRQKASHARFHPPRNRASRSSSLTPKLFGWHWHDDA